MQNIQKYYKTSVDLLFLLQGCTSDLFQGNQPIPEETVSELVVHGASLGLTDPRANPLPDDVGASIDDFYTPSALYAGSLSILIMPNEFVENNIDSGVFFFGFSKVIGNDEFEFLLNPKFSDNGVPSKVFVELFKSSGLLPGLEVLADTADFMLDHSPFILPLDATHLELGYRANEALDSAPVAIERWDLTNFYGYTRYMQPLIDSHNR